MISLTFRLLSLRIFFNFENSKNNYDKYNKYSAYAKLLDAIK